MNRAFAQLLNLVFAHRNWCNGDVNGGYILGGFGGGSSSGGHGYGDVEDNGGFSLLVVTAFVAMTVLVVVVAVATYVRNALSDAFSRHLSL